MNCILAAMMAWASCIFALFGTLAVGNTRLSSGGVEVGSESWLPKYQAAGIRCLVCRYSGSALVSTQAVAPQGETSGQASWVCTRQQSGDQLKVTFRLTKGTANSTGVAVAFDFPHWSEKNYVLVPGVVYGGNRFHALKPGYMPEFPPNMYFNPGLPVTTSDNPRLSIEPGKLGKIELLTGNATTPAMGFYSPADHTGFLLLTEQQSQFGNNGLFIEENATHRAASFVVSAPGVRQRVAQFGGFAASGDKGATWNAGDSVTLKFRVCRFTATSVPSFLGRFMAERKSLTGANHPRNLVPMSELADVVVPRFSHRWTKKPFGSWYAPENDDNFQLGWVSGFMQTPMLALNNAIESDRICQQLDFVTAKLQGPSGFFYAGIMANGSLRSDRGFGERRLVLTRKNADTLLMYFKFFKILEAQGHGAQIKSSWEKAARRLAEAFCLNWTRYRQWGQYLDPVDGRICVFNTTGGAIASAGLALASEYFHDARYLKVAGEAAKMHFHRDIEGHGFTNGACGDITQDPDSETAFGFLESTMALYGATKDPQWLERSAAAASLASTWVLSYDAVFPLKSQIGRNHSNVAGAVFASAQNKHGAPGICTSSGDSLFKLYRATNIPHFAELIRDIQHAAVEAMDMPGHRTTGTGFGASMERIQPTDAEGKDAIGNFYPTQNAWTELDNLMMATELPGIYVQTDRNSMFVFDHVEARVLRREAGTVTLSLTNRTNYDARVSVFAETVQEATKPLDWVAYLGWPKVVVASGRTVKVKVQPGRVVPID